MIALVHPQWLNRPAGGTPERFGERVRQEIRRWTRVVNAAGIKAD